MFSGAWASSPEQEESRAVLEFWGQRALGKALCDLVDFWYSDPCTGAEIGATSDSGHLTAPLSQALLVCERPGPSFPPGKGWKPTQLTPSSTSPCLLPLARLPLESWSVTSTGPSPLHCADQPPNPTAPLDTHRLEPPLPWGARTPWLHHLPLTLSLPEPQVHGGWSAALSGWVGSRLRLWATLPTSPPCLTGGWREGHLQGGKRDTMARPAGED